MAAFSEALYEANEEPLHLVLDEADLWAPHRPIKGWEGLLGHIEEIVRQAPEMLRALTSQGEAYMDADELAAMVGKKPSGGHWNSGIGVCAITGSSRATCGVTGQPDSSESSLSRRVNDRKFCHGPAPSILVGIGGLTFCPSPNKPFPCS
jgi:hypothetical protein